MPDTLGEAGRALWLGISGAYVLDPGEPSVLLAACQTADAVAAMSAEVRADGHMDSDGRPQPRLVR